VQVKTQMKLGGSFAPTVLRQSMQEAISAMG
jgi:hypothetical protein